MTDCDNIAGVLLAAGRGTRFGGNKLEAKIGSVMIGIHAARSLATTDCKARIAVHDPAHPALASALAGEGFTLIANHDPAAGLSHSLALATRRVMTTAAQAMLVCLGDMPFVSADHFAALIAAHRLHPDRIIASTAGDAPMPPVLFPAAHWAPLLDLRGEPGAQSLLKQALCITATAHELIDIDDRETWAAMQRNYAEPK